MSSIRRTPRRCSPEPGPLAVTSSSRCASELERDRSLELKTGGDGLLSRVKTVTRSSGIRTCTHQAASTMSAMSTYFAPSNTSHSISCPVGTPPASAAAATACGWAHAIPLFSGVSVQWKTHWNPLPAQQYRKRSPLSAPASSPASPPADAGGLVSSTATALPPSRRQTGGSHRACRPRPRGCRDR